ncbi:hypothetical protein CPB84DRAFT_1765356 [Gymnopilus junonius]|uniref:Protein kinase domain-containing protein n=1 Tax=Gymnopilus junonius TaxID=109634 RepID=A0A9P5TSN5_GYMJU|nr:hypothetical protein CPB84DRAFT_1765356 [Gymnopilus junonius]
MEHVGLSVDQISVDDFEKYVLPKIPAGVEVEDVFQHLLHTIDPKSKRPLLDLENGFLSMTKNSDNQGDHETKYFAPLKEIHNQIVNAARHLSKTSVQLEPILQYVVGGDMTPISDRKSSNRPDGYETIIQGNKFHSGGPNYQSKKVSWLDIIRSDEYKKDNKPGDLFDDIAKVCWSAHHTLRNDARRRFTYGLTIEETDSRMWFFDRQAIITSQCFSYMKEPKRFIHLVLSLSFADPTDLGYDPTVRLYKNIPESEFQYDIEFGGSTYRTLEILSSFQADTIRGRATRVFKARKVVNGKVNENGPFYVIKDIWMDDNRESEGKILENVLRTVPKEFHPHFLNVIGHGNVGVNGVDDNTFLVHLRGLDVKASRTGYLKTSDDDSIAHDVHVSRGLPPEADLPDRYPQAQSFTYYHKNHYRIIFDEFCTPLEAVRDWPTIFGALKKTVEVIIAMYDNGQWVHRDLSTGNILLVNGTDNVKLGDLEFAQQVGKGTPHAMRTGTLAFMSIEVMATEYAFPEDNDDDDDDNPFENSTKMLDFVHNPLHDLESVWWIFMRFLFRFIPEGEYKRKALETQLFESMKLFFDSESQIERYTAFSNPIGFKTLKYILANQFCARELFRFASRFRRLLVEAYKEVEKNFFTSGVSYDGLPEAFSRIRELFREGIEGLDSCRPLEHLQSKYDDLVKMPAVD